MSIGQIAAAVLAVALVAGVAWRRRRLSRERMLIGLAIAVALGVYASGLLSKLPDPKEIIEDIAQALGAWTYALVGLMAFLETGAFVGLVAPGETVVIAGGVIAGQGEIQLIPLIGLVWTCAVLGDSASFFIGRRLGRAFLERHGPRVGITEERLKQVEAYFDRHGGKTILIGRFIGLVRAIAPFIAGSSGLAYKRFIPYSVVGAGLWSTLFCVLGYIFWRSFDRVVAVAGHAILAFGITVGVIVGVVVLYRNRRKIAAWLQGNRDKPAVRALLAVAEPIQRRVVAPIARVAGPRLRFLRDRLTPGDLGLELTTALAVGGIGMYVFVLYVVVLGDTFAPTPFDRQFLDLADQLRTTTGVDIAKLVSGLGTLPATSTLVIATVVLLATRRQPAALVTLVVAFVLVIFGVQLAKAGIDRPRPADPLVHTSNSSYPSAHAAYATAWIACAVVATRRAGLASQATIVLVAIGIAAAVGLSRVYLRAHYWSDVAGGWGLGIGIFGLLAAIALVVEHIRHNEAGQTAESVGSRDR
jgi:membrane protein DedA with SNARE-associated domain/membrane-associated phospholipid phosphatase